MVVLLSLLGCPNEIGLNDSSKAPQVTLISPVDGGVFDPAEPIAVCAAVDFEGELSSLRISLTSDIDGVLATEGFGACPGGDLGLSVRLSPAVHTLSFTVTDARVTTPSTLSASSVNAEICLPIKLLAVAGFVVVLLLSVRTAIRLYLQLTL